MASQELDSDSYEPSQLMDVPEGLENRSRPLRSAHTGTRRTSALFQPGGALDSQTSDSQWVSSFSHDASHLEGCGDLVDASTQTDESSYMADTSCCDHLQNEIKELREESARMQAECQDELARMEAAYAGVVGHLEAVRAALADEPIVLDPTEQSQKIMTPRRAYAYPAPRAYASPSTPTDTSPSPAVHASSPLRTYASSHNRAARGPRSVKAPAPPQKRFPPSKSMDVKPSPSVPGPSTLRQKSRTATATARTSLSRAHESKFILGKRRGGSTREDVIVVSSSEAEEVPQLSASRPSVKQRRRS
ncbi:hypothetical protein VTO73DRAFT_11448 [Trametes versicolor]